MSDASLAAASYSYIERVDYLIVVASIAASDGDVHHEEKLELECLARALGLPDSRLDVVFEQVNERDGSRVRLALDRLGRSELRFALLTECISLAYADGVVVPEEEAEIVELAEALAIVPDQVAALREFVEALRHASGDQDEEALKQLGEQIAARVHQVGIPLSALAIAGGGSAGRRKSTAGLVALGVGLGMMPSVGVAVGLGLGTYVGVRWVFGLLQRRSS